MLALLLVASITGEPAHSVEIQIPAGVRSEKLFIRYVLAGDKVGGLIEPRSSVSSYIISTALAGGSATGIKAILYAPACAIQTLDVEFSSAVAARYPFVCRPLGIIPLSGKVLQPAPLYARNARVQVRYVARWARTFLGLSREVIPVIPVGGLVPVESDGQFRMDIPDLSRDPIAGAGEDSGELQISAREADSDVLLAKLVPTGPRAPVTRMGGLTVQSAYPAELAFAACGQMSSMPHSPEGFAIRGAIDPCIR